MPSHFSVIGYESRPLARDHVIGLIYLLENLGFVINKPKSILEPTQSLDWMLDPAEMGSTRSGHVCIQTDNSAEEVLKLETRSRGRSSGCLQPELGQPTGKGYANPPWNLVGRVLNRVRQQQVTLVLVAPVWKSQPWYPILLDMLADFPILIPNKEDLIIPTHPEGVPARYEVTWDVSIVLNYIESLWEPDSLSLQILTWKLAMIWH